MKTVISASNNTLTASFDKRFGRAEWFCIYDDETKDVSFVVNEHVNASNGAGTKVAEKLIDMGIKKAISGDFGPKAKELLDKFDVQMLIMQEDGLTVEDIIKKLTH